MIGLVEPAALTCGYTKPTTTHQHISNSSFVFVRSIANQEAVSGGILVLLIATFHVQICNVPFINLVPKYTCSRNSIYRRFILPLKPATKQLQKLAYLILLETYKIHINFIFKSYLNLFSFLKKT